MPRDFKLFTKIFLLFFVLVFLLVDGGTTFIILSYKIRQGVKLVKYELTRPPIFLSPANELHKNTTSSLDLVLGRKLPGYQITNISSSSRQSIVIPPEADKENILLLPKFNIKAPIIVVKEPKLWLIYLKLRKGVVLYPGSAIPGQGYSIIIGHSSQYPWKPGKYKRVFSLLSELEKGDKIYVFWKKKPLVFEVEKKKIFLPWPKGTETTETVFPPSSQPTLILQSCWPVGVAAKRIAVKTVLIK